MLLSQGLLGAATFTLVLPIPGARPVAGAIVLVALLQTAIVFGPEIVSGIGTVFQEGNGGEAELDILFLKAHVEQQRQ